MRPSWNEYHLLQAKLAAVRSTCNSRPQGAVLVHDNRIIATGYNGALPGQEHCSDVIIPCKNCGGGKKLIREHNLIDCPVCHGTGQIPYCHRRASNVPDSRKDRACVSSHAEANAMAQAARLGVATSGSVLYCTTRPCAVCTKILVMAGVIKVFFELDYDDPDGDWLRELLPMERLEVSCQATELAQVMLRPKTSRRRLGRTE